MRTSESIKNIAPALLAAQKLMGGAKKGASNPYFKSKYADLGSVLEACKDLLNDAGIVILQPHTNRDGKNFVETVLIHAASGEWYSSETEVVCSKANDPQALGSAITYARRYGLQSLLSMPAEDDDGNAAASRTTEAKSTPKTTVATPVKAATTPAPAAKVETPVKAAEPAKTEAAAPARPKPSFRKSATAAGPTTSAPASTANGVAKKTDTSNLGW